MASTYVEMDNLADRLPELIDAVSDGGEVVITRADQPVARLIHYEGASKKRRLGAAHGSTVLGDDFNKPLDDFAEHSMNRFW